MHSDQARRPIRQTTPDHTRSPEARSVPVWVQLPPAPLEGPGQRRSGHPSKIHTAACSKRAANLRDWPASVGLAGVTTLGGGPR